ncbi:MAG: hypothetical protein H0W01_17995 [Pseudonocardiales bacterium]|nr:hypothetical protein [Pseudonocardiales bacterium]
MAEQGRETKQPLTFRVQPAALRRLRHHAEELGVSQTSLAERYLEEGLRRDVHPLVYFRDGAGGRRAAVIGTRLDVWQVVDTVKNSDGQADAAATYLEIPRASVYASLRYYAEYADEIDHWTKRAAGVAEREQSLS